MAMKVLLKDDVKGLGKMGDVVTVADGYARNFLLPRLVAVVPSAGNLKQIEIEKKRRAASELERISDYKQLAERINAIDVTLKERVSSDDKLYGAVSARAIVEALANDEINIDEDMVKMDEPIKSLGVHRVVIKLHSEVSAELKVWVVALKENEEQPAE
ncbi:MAG: 50S ribosomal protein L9 [Planctomycetes bacterium]|nr:50S ribosomal protein L9 [Planctomycetota bacterium]